MPKQKTNRGAAKRFKRTGTGKLKRRRAYRNHILTKKATKRKRQLRTNPYVKGCEEKAVNAMLVD